MPYETELTDDCMGVVHRGSGMVTGEEILRGSLAVSQLVQNTENFHYEFVDLSEATEFKFTDRTEADHRRDRMTRFFSAPTPWSYRGAADEHLLYSASDGRAGCRASAGTRMFRGRARKRKAG